MSSDIRFTVSDVGSRQADTGTLVLLDLPNDPLYFAPGFDLSDFDLPDLHRAADFLRFDKLAVDLEFSLDSFRLKDALVDAAQAEVAAS